MLFQCLFLIVKGSVKIDIYISCLECLSEDFMIVLWKFLFELWIHDEIYDSNFTIHNK